ncbi:polyunsaturated fatty acid lipoxygenase ALOX8-like [Patagioenas fasciata]|uniref:polyunsaturated fatty acid lipoxygenase ALOX8-like n=1 Tax=Patagioenas fasciata TaxID=372321 RepID=UPI003A98D3BF
MVQCKKEPAPGWERPLIGRLELAPPPKWKLIGQMDKLHPQSGSWLGWNWGTQASGEGPVRYRLRVTTGTEWGGGTLATVTLTLVGTEGQSGPCHLRWPQQQLRPGTTLVASVTSPCPLGPLLLLRVHTEPLVSLVPDHWLLERLPPSLAFPIGHRVNIIARAAAAQFRFRRCGASWKSFEELHEALGKPGTPIAGVREAPRWDKRDPGVRGTQASGPAEYVLQHWRDDAFFGAQYLSGVNPVLLRRCHRLPPNFPVTPRMVAPSLGPHTSLQGEMEASEGPRRPAAQGGRLFLADYAMLRGVHTRPLGGAPQNVAPAICLLWLNPQGELRPIAIQLSQDPGVPIFTPQDAPWCWALAKLWVRGAHFTQHELVTHLLSTHFLAETFAVATQRLPGAHPVHQLLLPHFRFTFHINILARESLLNPGGIIDQATAVGREGTLELVARGTASLTYRELCVPEDIEDRGVALVPNYHYRDDALEIWAAMESLVQGVVSLHYPGDKEVAEDEELQSWVGDIFTYAVLGNQQSGFPSQLLTRADLVKFTTMIMFCCSARHSAVNSGQYDFAAWMPNTPGTLQGDPPVTKAEATEQRFLGTLPSPAATGALLALLSVVSYEGGQPRPLGSRCPELLAGAAAQRLIGRFRRRLAAISRRIGDRNRRLELPYPYLDPTRVTESVAI